MVPITLRMTDDLAAFLRQAAREEAMSMNGYLVRLLRRERHAARKRCLAADWSAYAADLAAQDVAYALGAQAEQSTKQT
jgi:hypothetical protein